MRPTCRHYILSEVLRLVVRARARAWNCRTRQFMAFTFDKLIITTQATLILSATPFAAKFGTNWSAGDQSFTCPLAWLFVECDGSGVFANTSCFTNLPLSVRPQRKLFLFLPNTSTKSRRTKTFNWFVTSTAPLDVSHHCAIRLQPTGRVGPAALPMNTLLWRYQIAVFRVAAL